MKRLIFTFLASFLIVIFSYDLQAQNLDSLQACYIRQLDTLRPELRAELHIIRVDYDQKNGRLVNEYPMESNRKADSNLVFHAGDIFYFQIINHSQQDFYANILLLQSNDSLYCLLPGDQQTPVNSFLVPASDTLKMPNRLFAFGPPYGEDVFKLIVADQPIHLHAIVSGRHVQTQDVPSPHEAASRALQQSVNRARGPMGRAFDFEITLAGKLFNIHLPLPASYRPHKVSVSSLAVKIKPKKFH